MSAPAVRVENLWKRFGWRRALAAVDLEVADGACLAVFGPNGAGKSTLLRILATLTRATSGRVALFGRELRGHLLEARRRIGVVFHDNCLRADLSLDENLALYAGLYGAPPRGERVDALLALVGLDGRRRDPVRGFSQGMLKRATLVRSLLHEPRVWFLDEPFSGLDPDGRRMLEGLIRGERERGRTVIFITHDVERGLGLADDAVLLRDGEVAARGRDAVRGALAAAAGEETAR